MNNGQKKGITIGLVINDIIFRNGMSSFISQHESMEVIFAADKIDELEDHLQNKDLDICIADLHLHHEETARRLELLRKIVPALKFVLFSNTQHPYNIKKAVAIGCNGIIDKYSNAMTIIKALLSVHYTGNFYEKSPGMKSVYKNNKNDLITDLELTVLKSLCSNKTNKEISMELNMSLPIITAYQNVLFQKLHVSSREMLIRCAYTLGLIEC